MKGNNLAKSAATNWAKIMVLGLVALAATGAFAGNKGSLHVGEAVAVNGQQLPAGDYQLRWEGTGATVELTFMQGKKEVAKATAKTIELDRVPSYDSAVLDHGSGKAWISEVRFAGKKTAFSLGAGDGASMGEGSSK